MDEQEAEAYVAKLKALAHPVRLRMIDLIHAHGGEICVCEFEHHFDVKQPTISHHLKILRDAGLLQSHQKGSWVHHYVEPGAFEQLQDLMARFVAAPAAP
jgi:ArsR family transcriptional regulator